MSTLGIMRTRIASEMKRGDISAGASTVIDAIVSAIQHFENERFFFNEFNDTTTSASASVTYLSLSAFGINLVSVDTMKAVIGTRDYALSKEPWAEIDGKDSGQYYGYPSNYVFHSNTVRLYPPPADNYLLKIAGVRQLMEVSAAAADSATNGWMTDAEEMIRLHAKGNLFRDQLRAPQQADYFYAAAERCKNKVKKRGRKMQATGRARKRY
mgnify:FL=1